MVRVILAVVLTITLFLTGCASKRGITSKATTGRYRQQTDSAPALSQVPRNIHKIPDAVPKLEPKSKYGNPASYVVLRKKYHVLPSSTGYRSTGTCSWYGTKFHGYRTSSGELYDMYKMTAAHKTLPLPTYVQVKNLDNGKKVIVKVNDRGPFHGNRLLDLSYAAAAKLEILGKGTGRIEVTAIDAKKLPIAPRYPTLATKQPEYNMAKPSVVRAKTLAINKANPAQPVTTTNKEHSTYRYLQVGAFNNRENAESLRKKILQLSNHALQVYLQTSSCANAPIFRVRIGPIDNLAILNKVRNQIIQAKLPIPIAIP